MESKFVILIQSLRSRWMMAVASFFMLSFAGSPYIFGLYSQHIKTTLQYDQKIIDMLAFFKDMGLNAGILAGIINEVAGPRVVLSLGSILNLGGYVMIWLSVTGRVSRPAEWQMYLYQLIGGSSMTFINTAVVVTCVKNFPRGRGLVIGLLKGFVGLSGAIITQIYKAVRGDDPSFLIFLAATLPSTVIIALMGFIRRMDSPKEKNEMRNFYVFLGMALMLAAFLMIFILLENRLDPPLSVVRLFAVITVLTIFVPLIVVVRSQMENPQPDLEKPKMSSGVEMSGAKTQALEACTGALEGTGKEIEKVKSQRKRPLRGEDHSVFEALSSADFWILFVAAICGLGSAITAIDNMGQIGKSLQYSPLNISTFVSLLSIWNFLGRVASGTISEILVQRFTVPRPLILSVVMGIACVGHLLIAFAFSGSIYFASIIIGTCFGAQWPLLFSIVSELFGLRHIAILYNVMQSASPLGSYLFSVRVAGFLYDRRATVEYHHNKHADELMCVGKQCFHTSFLIMSALSTVGCGVASVLAYRTREFYKQDLYGKFNNDGDNNTQDH